MGILRNLQKDSKEKTKRKRLTMVDYLTLTECIASHIYTQVTQVLTLPDLTLGTEDPEAWAASDAIADGDLARAHQS